MHSWQLKDYVFAAFMSIGTLLAAVITQGFALMIPLPGARAILWAPFAGVFLTLAMARLRHVGAVFLVITPVGLLLGLINPIIPIVLISAAAITEGVMTLRKGYGGSFNRFLGNVVFFEGTILLSMLAAVTGLTQALGLTPRAINLPLWLAVPAIGIGALMGSLAWWLGEQVVRQLVKAGKLDEDL